jgi:peptide/nickel transport system ATP-binding protein
MSAPSLLNVERLSVRFGTKRSPLGALHGASFQVARGETVCLVGESGCGKTVMALSILRLEQYRAAQIVEGDVIFEGRGLGELGRAELDQLRGRRISMIFQEPMTAFDPLFSIGDQLIEAIQRHDPVSREVASARALALLKRVRIPDPELRMTQIPEELSGGMRQRAMIAMALSCKPDLLIADEPTTALDVTIQAQILALLKDIQREDGMGILLITHDLGVAAEMADRIVVMYAGRVVEQGRAQALFTAPKHPYTRALLHSAIPHEGPRKRRLRTIQGAMPRLEDMPSGCSFHPRCSERSERCTRETPALIALPNEPGRELACFNSEAERPEPGLYLVPATEEAVLPAIDRGALLLEAQHVSKHFDVRTGLFGGGARVFALDDVSFSIARGETLGLVGESGCGKSTLGRILVQLERPSSGEIHFAGQKLGALSRSEQKRLRRDMQMVFQDPYDSIDPRFSVFEVVAEPLRAQERLSAQALRTRVQELLELVGLSAATGSRYARELSGGQRQRVGIARAIALSPKFIVADEAVSALDLSVQAQILNLLADLRERLGLTSLFIGHGLNVVRHVSDRIGVMYLGRLVEVGEAEELFRRPAHHYTAALLASIPAGFSPSAAPLPGRSEAIVAPLGELPSPSAPPSGCHFHPRCPAATERCRREAPALSPIAAGRLVACHRPIGA